MYNVDKDYVEGTGTIVGIILPVIDNAIMLALFVQVSIQWMFLTP